MSLSSPLLWLCHNMKCMQCAYSHFICSFGCACQIVNRIFDEYEQNDDFSSTERVNERESEKKTNNNK